MWIPRLLRLRGTESIQRKRSVLPSHSSVHPHACCFLPPRPHVPVPQFPRPHRGAVALTSLSGVGTPGEPGAAAWGAGQGGRASACLRANRLGVCAPAGGGWRRARRATRGSSVRRCAPASVQMWLGPASPLPRAGWVQGRGTSPSPPAGTPLPPTRSPHSPPGYPPNPRMVRPTATAMFIR